MSSKLLQLGAGFAAVAVWLYLGAQAGWVEGRSADHWGPLALKASLACLAGGLILRAVSPMGRKLREGRCVRCGHPVERGQLYCRDHMKETIEEYRDQTRDGVLRGRGAR